MDEPIHFLNARKRVIKKKMFQVTDGLVQMMKTRAKNVKLVSRDSDGMKIRLPDGLSFETHGDFRRWAHANFFMVGNSVEYVSHIPATSEDVRKFPAQFVFKVSDSEFLDPETVFLSNGRKIYGYHIEYFEHESRSKKQNKKPWCLSCVIC